MKVFQQDQLREAIAHAREGGQSLHLHRIIVDRSRAPRCFVREVDAGRDICHLLDHNLDRLCKTARRLGVRVILVERGGTDTQHIDICAGPLRKAIAEAKGEQGS